MRRQPIDLLNLAVILLLATIATIGFVLGRLPETESMLPRLAGMLAMLAAGIICKQRWGGTRWGRLVGNFYPVLLVPLVYDSLQPLITVVGMPNVDGRLIEIDRALLGADAAVYLQRFVTPALSDCLHIAYCAYFVFPLVVGIALWRSSPARGARFIFVVVLAFYASYVGYFLFPALGPRFAQADQFTVSTHTSAISRFIYDTLNNAESTRDDVFPSGHVMVTAVCLLAAHGFNKRLFWSLLPVGVAVAAATIYCRYHYVIDVIAGLALAFVTFPLGNWLYDLALKRRAVRRVDTSCSAWPQTHRAGAGS